MRPSCKRMPTKLCMMVEAGADHPGVPAISFVSNFDRHGAGPSQEPRSPFFISARLPQFEIIFDAISTLDYLAFFQTWQRAKPKTLSSPFIYLFGAFVCGILFWGLLEPVSDRANHDQKQIQVDPKNEYHRQIRSRPES